MATFQQTIHIPVQPARVFDFVARVENMPRYLPTARSAQPAGTDRVRVQGEANGQRYDADGFLRCDREALRLEWGADEGYYSGWLQVDVMADQSVVTVALDFRAAPHRNAPSEAEIRDGLVSALESIRNAVMSEGAKVEPQAATRAGQR